MGNSLWSNQWRRRLSAAVNPVGLIPAILIVTFAFLLAGCGTTYQAYPGSALPSDQVAILKLEQNTSAPGGVGVRGIDGKQVQCNYGDAIQLLPGQHTISFIWYIPLNPYGPDEYGPVMQTLVVQGGKTYSASLGWKQPGNSVSPLFNGPYSPQNVWWVVISQE